MWRISPALTSSPRLKLFAKFYKYRTSCVGARVFFYAQTCIASLQCPKAISRSDSARAHPSRGIVWLKGCSGIKVCSTLSSPVGLIRLFNMPIVTSDVLSSVEPDYIIVGGGTAGLVLAARYVAKARS